MKIVYVEGRDEDGPTGIWHALITEVWNEQTPITEAQIALATKVHCLLGEKLGNLGRRVEVVKMGYQPIVLNSKKGPLTKGPVLMVEVIFVVTLALTVKKKVEIKCGGGDHQVPGFDTGSLEAETIVSLVTAQIEERLLGLAEEVRTHLSSLGFDLAHLIK